MDKKALFIIALIALCIGSGVIYLLDDSGNKATYDSKTKPKQTISTTQPITKVPSSKTESTTTQPGLYKDYDANVITETKGTKLLFFHAPWCSQCRSLEEDIKKNGVPSGVVVIKVDYDSNQNLRQKYGVTLQTTLVKVDDQGNLVEKYVSYEEPTLEAVKRNLL